MDESLFNNQPVPAPAWNGTAETVRRFIRNFSWLCKRNNFPLHHRVQEILSYIPSSEFAVWESVAQVYPKWDDFVKKILEYYPQPSLADSSYRLEDLITRFKMYHNTSNKDIFFAYLRQFTSLSIEIERHRTVPNDEKVSMFSEGLKAIIRALFDKHNPQNMDEVIAAGNAVFNYIGSFDSETKGFFRNLVESTNLRVCQQSVIVQAYTPLSSVNANRDEPGLTLVSHGQTNT
ncbi:hypothetical protein FA15DRAFT_732557 [Coprinopsis marcescibilis]|uniref:Retrotransposon gag domain-containing protein n=1 Tax=Coprinopsis marcescibilis TaxID=230819 RepID=A0A5C3KE60_COPMA|nr:hypothetical protein FA15DRAFT_732557 [Coprinopsis marcescibilis]